MIINWRWEGFTTINKSFQINNESGDALISIYNKNEVSDFNRLIAEQIVNQKPEYLLVLTHFNPQNRNTDIQIDKSKITIQSKEKMIAKVRNIRGGNVSKEFNYIYDKINGMINTDSDNYKSQLRIENFDKVWKFYWDVIELEYQKKQLINLWLPFAIDIQGLSEVQSKIEKAEKYFKKVKEETKYLDSLSHFPKDEDFPRWIEIIEELKKDSRTKPYAEFKPKSIVGELIKEGSTLELFKNTNYLASKIDDDPNHKFLPNWLQEVVNIIDKKIKESSEQVEENEVAKS